MGRLRSRALSRGSSAVHSPTSWAFLITTFGFAFVWAVFIIFTVVALSCVQAIGITLSPAFGIAPIDLFWLGFVTLACLSFVNTVRYRPTRQHYTHRAFEALLIFFGLVTVSEWESVVHPGLGDRPVMEFIHDEVVMRFPFFQTDEVLIEEYYEELVLDIDPPSGVEWGSFPELRPPAPYVDESRFPLGILNRPARECACWANVDEITRQEHHWVDERLHYGFITPQEAEEQRAALPPVPVEADWCPVVRDLARTPR